MKRYPRVKLPDGRLGNMIEEKMGDGWAYAVVITDEGDRVISHPIRLAPALRPHQRDEEMK